MRLVYYTIPPFLDSDLPYLKSFKNGSDELYTIIDISSYSLQSSILNINKQHPIPGIFKASIYKEIVFFNSYLNLDKTYIVNRTNKKAFALSNLVLNIKLFFLVFNIKPNLIHTTRFYNFQDLFLYLFRKKTILTVHDPFPHTGENNFRNSFFRNIGFKLIKNFILLNSSQKAEFISTYKMNKKNIFISKLGPYTCYNLFSTNEQNKSKTNTVLFFGRISPYKGIDILLKAMKTVHKTHPDVQLIIAGNGKYYFDKSEYEKLEYINFRNRYIPNEELIELIKQSLFVVVPYIDATQSGVIMSSYAFNTPVITTNVGGLAEMVENNITGLIIDANDEIALQNSITELLSNPEYVLNMEKNIYKKYHIGHSGWASISLGIKKIYYQILNDYENTSD